MKIRKIERITSIVLLLLCGALAIQLGIGQKKVTHAKRVYKERTQTEEGKLPVKYDLRNQQKAPRVKDQGSKKTCWATAASSALESALLPKEKTSFSEDHMSSGNSFTREADDGGDYTMVMAYLAGWQGPISSDQAVTQQTPAKHVQEMQLFQEKDYEAIKRAVYQYGAVQSSLYMDMQNAFSSSVYYNQLNYSYRYPGEEQANHDVLIIGWDDNYPAENFNVYTERDGAFICQNSWGKDFGEDGIFYVSYEDGNIGKKSISYTKIESSDNYANMYQTDLCGWVGQLGYGDGTCYFANIFQAEQEELLEAVGFYATGADTEYEISVMDGEKDLSNALLEENLASGTLEQAGYYTIRLNKMIQMEKEKKYAVVIKVYTPGEEYPVAAEYAADDATREVDLSDGDGYISHNGAKWTGTESEYYCNVCMKVYTRTEIKEEKQ